MLITFDIADNENATPIAVAQSVIKFVECENDDGLVVINKLLEIAGHISLYANHRLAVKDYNKE